MFARAIRRIKAAFPLLLLFAIINVLSLYILESTRKSFSGAPLRETFLIFPHRQTVTPAEGNEILKPRVEEAASGHQGLTKNLSDGRLVAISVPDNIPGILENPWIDSPFLAAAEDLLASDAHNSVSVGKCVFRQFFNHSVYSKSEFVADYLRYKTCQGESNDTATSEWLKDKIGVQVGSKGQLFQNSKFQYEEWGVPLCDDSGEKPLKLLFAVFSHAESRLKRNAIRRTWGRKLDKENRLIFFIQPAQSSSLLQELSEESKAHGDLVAVKELGHIVRDQSIRMSSAVFSWIYERCSNVRFVVRTTDSTFINEKRFGLLAHQERFAANRMYGNIMRKKKAFRIQDSDGQASEANHQPDFPSPLHHVAPDTVWPWRYFPPFLQGPSFVLSGDVVVRLLMAIQCTPTMQALPQVFLTGLVPLVNKVMRIGVTGFFAHKPPQQVDECSYAKFGAIENIESERLMKMIWTSVQDTQEVKNVTCTIKPTCLAKINGQCMYYSNTKNEG